MIFCSFGYSTISVGDSFSSANHSALPAWIVQKVDYGLLVTFVSFFIIVGNIGDAEFINTFLKTLNGKEIYLAGLGLSQVISNVPSPS